MLQTSWWIEAQSLSFSFYFGFHHVLREIWGYLLLSGAVVTSQLLQSVYGCHVEQVVHTFYFDWKLAEKGTKKVNICYVFLFYLVAIRITMKAGLTRRIPFCYHDKFLLVRLKSVKLNLIYSLFKKEMFTPSYAQLGLMVRCDVTTKCKQVYVFRWSQIVHVFLSRLTKLLKLCISVGVFFSCIVFGCHGDRIGHQIESHVKWRQSTVFWEFLIDHRLQINTSKTALCTKQIWVIKIVCLLSWQYHKLAISLVSSLILTNSILWKHET